MVTSKEKKNNCVQTGEIPHLLYKVRFLYVGRRPHSDPLGLHTKPVNPSVRSYLEGFKYPSCAKRERESEQTLHVVTGRTLGLSLRCTTYPWSLLKSKTSSTGRESLNVNLLSFGITQVQFESPNISFILTM